MAIGLLAGLSTTLLALGLAPASASSANISHSYQASTPIPDGSLVSLSTSRPDYVEPANTKNGEGLLGVAVGKDSLLAVDAGAGKAQVATSGSALVLVSTVNGEIRVGDQIGVSPFNGVGMKALLGSRVIGLAQTAFTGSEPGATTRQITAKDGKVSSIKVGFARVSIAIGTYSNGVASSSLNGLQRFAKSLTGRTVPTIRVAMSLVVALVAMLALITLIYASIYGSIVSIGRNPLAKFAIFRTLGSVLGMVILTAVVSGVTIFFLLR